MIVLRSERWRFRMNHPNYVGRWGGGNEGGWFGDGWDDRWRVDR